MKQGEIWLINLGPTIGAEIRKTRPAVALSKNEFGNLPLSVVAPITGWKQYHKSAPWMVKINPSDSNNLKKVSSIDCFQVRSISKKRFIKKVGVVSSKTHSAALQSLKLVFE
jgi:mRNA interferase MazF